MSGQTLEIACLCENSAASCTQFDSCSLPAYDETNGRFGEVSILRGYSWRNWLRFIEHDGFIASGRWVRALMDGKAIPQIKPENALSHLRAALLHPRRLPLGQVWPHH